MNKPVTRSPDPQITRNTDPQITRITQKTDPQITQDTDPRITRITRNTGTTPPGPADPQAASGASASATEGLEDPSAVLAGILEVAHRHLDWDGAVSPDMPLLETFNLDSLRQLTLVVELEDRFRIRLDQRDEESIITVGDLVDAIGRKLAGRSSDAR